MRVQEHALGMLLNLLNHLRVLQGDWKASGGVNPIKDGVTVTYCGCWVWLMGVNALLLNLGEGPTYDKYKQGYAPEGICEVSLEELQAEAYAVTCTCH